jgi:tetratricopeptide (TPR) repeat protein
MKNVLIGLCIIAGLLVVAGCGKNKDLKMAGEKAQKGEYKEAIELYTSITMHEKDVRVLDEARVALAQIYYKQKNYENALKCLEDISKDRQVEKPVQELMVSVTADNNVIEGIKSAAVQYRMQFVKEKEIKHEALDFTTPIFTGMADSLFVKAAVKPPHVSELGKFAIEIRLTDDPLEPTKLKITYPDASLKEIALNY